MSELTPEGEEATGIVDDLVSADNSPRADLPGIPYQEQGIQDEDGFALGSELDFDEEVEPHATGA